MGQDELGRTLQLEGQRVIDQEVPQVRTLVDSSGPELTLTVDPGNLPLSITIGIRVDLSCYSAGLATSNLVHLAAGGQRDPKIQVPLIINGDGRVEFCQVHE